MKMTVQQAGSRGGLARAATETKAQRVARMSGVAKARWSRIKSPAERRKATLPALNGRLAKLNGKRKSK